MLSPLCHPGTSDRTQPFYGCMNFAPFFQLIFIYIGEDTLCTTVITDQMASMELFYYLQRGLSGGFSR